MSFISTSEIAEIRERIISLKTKLNAVIVSHNYQRPEVQDIADFVGDSLELARKCAEVKAEVIVFCGVHFMAETAAILNPNSTVILAERTAGCPLADMIDVPELLKWRARYPNAGVVCYVNSSAAVKAESDICCTSANAVKVVQSLPHNEILFIPDKNLGHFVSTKVKDKRFILYPGYCIVHCRLTAKQVQRAKELYPQAKVIVHPECYPEVIACSDAVCSTSQMVKYVKESKDNVFLIGTEEGIIHRLKKENPDKTFYLLSPGLLCPNMKKTSLWSVFRAMEEMKNVIKVPEDIRIRAKRALDRMLAVV